MKVNEITLYDLYDVYQLLENYPDTSDPAPMTGSAYSGGWTPDSFLSQVQTITGATSDADDVIMNSLPFYEYDTDEAEWKLEENVAKLLQSIYRRYVHQIAITLFSGEILLPKVTSFFDNLLNLLTNTFPRYIIMLKAIETLTPNILAPVKITRTDVNVGKLKDTPQSNIDPASDAYNSAVTYNKNDSDVYDEKIDNIDKATKLRTEWQNIMYAWSNEFEVLFVDKENYNWG